MVHDLLDLLRCQRLSDTSMQLGREFSLPGKECGDELTLQQVREIAEQFGRAGLEGRITFTAEELFVRSRVEPLQAMFSQWMAGAAAEVRGESIPFKEIITWCQDCTDRNARRLLASEARTLCRLLAPLSHATWQALMAAVTEELGYESYIQWCQLMRSRPLEQEASFCAYVLDQGRSEYMARVEEWVQRVEPGMQLREASRFDAIYLLGMRYLDSLSRHVISLDKALEFFSGLGLREDSGICLHFEGRAGRQSYCVPVVIPGLVHVILGPVEGWLDWESLFHEMGHAFSFAHTAPDIPVEAREFFMSGAVSEAFAFLFQRLSMKHAFIEEVMGASGEGAVLDHLSEIEDIHTLKFQVLTRRYGAKFLIEYENFKHNRIARGQELYASVMERETGFSYHPETYLFDLMPDFYSLDYFLAFIASMIMTDELENRFGAKWFLSETACETLKTWASCGNLHDIHTFMKEVVGTGLEAEVSSSFGS